MCIDICPVGALTSGAYRYKTRPWEMKHVGTVCTHCGDGCKTTLGVRRADTGMQIVRGDNRDKSGINGDFLCIKGRYAFDFAHNEERIQQPLIKREGKFVPATWDQAFELIASKFKDALTNVGPAQSVSSVPTAPATKKTTCCRSSRVWCWARTTSITIAPPTSLLWLRPWRESQTLRQACVTCMTRPRFC